MFGGKWGGWVEEPNFTDREGFVLSLLVVALLASYLAEPVLIFLRF